MKIINPSYEILTKISENGIAELQHIEKIGRVCYKSEDKITDNGESAKKFVKMIIDKGHEAMIEHSSLSIKFTVDRGVSHELVRHRIASFAQESTRYCNYLKDKFGGECNFIDLRHGIELDNKGKNMSAGEIGLIMREWLTAMDDSEKHYFNMLKLGATPQIARSVLPNSTKTEITITANFREWRNFFKLRTAKTAHPQMREVTIPLLKELKDKLPVIFDDIKIDELEEEKKDNLIMDKQIFIINGSGGVGKDTFVQLVYMRLNEISDCIPTVMNFSSVDKIKEIAKLIGWKGGKTEKDRKFLSDLKLLSSKYCDMPFQSMKEQIDKFYQDKNLKILFLHIREPQEIDRAVKEFNAKTILITRNSIKHITSNTADKNVFNYNYDIIIENNGTIEDLRKTVDDFLSLIEKKQYWEFLEFLFASQIKTKVTNNKKGDE